MWNDGPNWKSKQGLFGSGVWPDGGGGRETSRLCMVVHQPNNVKVIDTSSFIKTKIDYGFDFVFHLIDSIYLDYHKLDWQWWVRFCLGERYPSLFAPVVWLATRRSSSLWPTYRQDHSNLPRLQGFSSLQQAKYLLLHYIVPAKGEACLDMMADLGASYEFDLERSLSPPPQTLRTGCFWAYDN